MSAYPSLEEDLAVLLGPKHNVLAPLDLDIYDSAADFAREVAKGLPKKIPLESLTALRSEVVTRLQSGKMGSLMGERLLNRDRQQRTLCSLGGPEPILDMLAEGVLLPRIAKRFEVSHAVLSEFIADTATPEQIMKAESLGADMMVDDAMEDLEDAPLDKDAINKSKALFDNKLKLAKAKSNKWTENKGDTYVQQNFGKLDASSPNTEDDGIEGFQVVFPDGDDPNFMPDRRIIPTDHTDTTLPPLEHDPVMPDGVLEMGGETDDDY